MPVFIGGDPVHDSLADLVGRAKLEARADHRQVVLIGLVEGIDRQPTRANDRDRLVRLKPLKRVLRPKRTDAFEGRIDILNSLDREVESSDRRADRLRLPTDAAGSARHWVGQDAVDGPHAD